MRHQLRLISTRFVNPGWWNLPEQDAVIVDTQTVQAYGETLQLVNPAEITLAIGQKAFVSLGRNFYLETEEERITEQQRREERRRQEEAAQLERDRKYRDDARALNASLNIPVAWVPGIKDVLSGLSANSMGNGCNAATVNHVLLKEELQDGRLQRQKGDFLCTSARGSNGKNWSWQPEQVWRDRDGEEVRPPVTCKACLKLAKRWSHHG